MSQFSAPNLHGAVDLSALKQRAMAPAAGSNGAAGSNVAGGAAGVVTAVSSFVMDVTDATFPEVMELSRRVPVVVDLWAEWCAPCRQLSPVLEKITTELGGKVLLAKVDVDANPQLAQAFKAQSIPLVVALLAGQPVPMFTGAVPEEHARQVFDQLLQVAAQQGVSGTLSTDPDAATADAPEAVPPLHAAAFAAIEAGDYPAAIAAYEQALVENPQDEDARAGLGQVQLLRRVSEIVDLSVVRQAAAESPTDTAAQFAVADVDMVGGHVDSAYDRLLDLFAQLSGEDRIPVRERLLELFALVGDADPRVLRARTRMASLMF